MVIIFLDNIWVFLNVRNYWILISNLSDFLSTANSDILGVFGTFIFFSVLLSIRAAWYTS